MGRRYLLTITALGEGATGLALLTVPSFVLALLLGVTSVAAETLVVARVAGGALVAIGLICWIARGDDARPARRGMLAAILIYDVVAAAALAWAGADLAMSGVALWPAAAAHVLLAVWCVAALAKG
ncbi:MAG TPA: hypothetical protein VKD90_29440 [Gemmataceae bacterium]|nr:hypothetical protein [Gemmataceae bacterium]